MNTGKIYLCLSLVTEKKVQCCIKTVDSAVNQEVKLVRNGKYIMTGVSEPEIESIPNVQCSYWHNGTSSPMFDSLNNNAPNTAKYNILIHITEFKMNIFEDQITNDISKTLPKQACSYYAIELIQSQSFDENCKIDLAW